MTAFLRSMELKQSSLRCRGWSLSEFPHRLDIKTGCNRNEWFIVDSNMSVSQFFRNFRSVSCFTRSNMAFTSRIFVNTSPWSATRWRDFTCIWFSIVCALFYFLRFANLAWCHESKSLFYSQAFLFFFTGIPRFFCAVQSSSKMASARKARLGWYFIAKGCPGSPSQPANIAILLLIFPYGLIEEDKAKNWRIPKRAARKLQSSRKAHGATACTR